MESVPESATALLNAASDGDPRATERLMPLVYDQLHALARAHMRAERSGHTLQTTAVVHEAYLRLIDQKQTSWKNRAHFFSIASHLIRHVLIDHARGRRRQRRGGDMNRITLLAEPTVHDGSVDVLDIHDALEQLETLDERQARVVELRFFGGLTVPECAEILHLSTRTIENEWRMARAWLGRRLKQGRD